MVRIRKQYRDAQSHWSARQVVVSCPEHDCQRCRELVDSKPGAGEHTCSKCGGLVPVFEMPHGQD